MFLRAYMVTNIITIFTGLANLSHVQAGHEAGFFLTGTGHEASEASHFSQKNFLLNSLTKDFEFHF